LISFSIIIPHFNSFELLKQLINSIPNSKNIEIIVVDDNSTSGDYIEEQNYYSHRKNILFLSNKYKKGAGGSRNTGLDSAKGKWIIFADSDDFFLENAFEEFNKYINSNSEVIFFNCSSIFNETGEIANRHLFFRKLVTEYLKNLNSHSENRLKYEFGVPWSKMISRELIEKNKIRFSEIIVLNDRMFSVKTGFYSKKISACEIPIYCNTRTKGSLITIQKKDYFEVKISELLRITNFMIENQIGKYSPSFLGLILSSRKYGIKYSINLILKVLKNDGKLLPLDFFKEIFNGYYLKKIMEKLEERKV